MNITPNTIHKIANKLGIRWDNDRGFMDWCEKITGKRHLDSMDTSELLKVYILLLLRQHPAVKNEDNNYLHRATAQYVSKDKTDKLKRVLSLLYTPSDDIENPKYVNMTKAAKRLRKRISM